MGVSDGTACTDSGGGSQRSNCCSFGVLAPLSVCSGSGQKDHAVGRPSVSCSSAPYAAKARASSSSWL